MLNRIFNVGLRGLTLAMKFVLLFALGRMLEPTQVGLYGLMFAAVTYGAGIAGFGFCKYANREVAALDDASRTVLLRDQAVFYALAYIAVLPAVWLVFRAELLPWTLFGWFLVLLVFEHIATELGRVLVVLHDQIAVTAVLFLRGGLWVIALVPLMAWRPEARSLDAVLAFWLVGSVLACAFGLWRTLRIGPWSWTRTVDWAWLRRGVRIAAPLLLATLVLKGLTTFDRFWIKSIGGYEVLAAYVLFAGISGVVKAFLDSGVFVFSYPKMILAARRGDRAAFEAGLRALAWQTAAVTLVIAGVAIFAINPLLAWIDRPVYGEHIELFYWSLLAIFGYAAAMVLHYAVYAYDQDRIIIVSHLVGLAAFGVTGFLLADWLGAVAIPIALCLAYFTIFLIKSVAFTHILRSRESS